MPIVTKRANNGSGVPIRKDAIIKFVAPRSTARRVTPRLSSRDLIEIGRGSRGAFVSATSSCTPVNGTGMERLSSIVRRRNSQIPAGKETPRFSAPPLILRIGLSVASWRHCALSCEPSTCTALMNSRPGGVSKVMPLSKDFVPVVSVIRVAVGSSAVRNSCDRSADSRRGMADRSSKVLRVPHCLICAHLRDRDAKHPAFPRADLSGSVRSPAHRWSGRIATRWASMHRAIWRTKTPGPENLQSTGSTGEHSTGISLDLLLGKTEKALVKERREDRDDGDDDERGYSIKLIQSRKIVQEKFENGDAKQSETRISHRPRRLTDPNNQEQQGEQRPRDAVAHVARKVSGKLKRERGHPRLAEVICDLDV